MKGLAYLTLLSLLPLFTPSLFSSEAFYDVLGIGNPCLDMVFEVENELFDQLHLNKGDGQLAPWDKFSLTIDKCKMRGINPVIATGGSCSNTIKGLASLGNFTALLGKIGTDPLSHLYCKNIESLKIAPLMVKTATPIMQVAVFVTPDHQRTFLTFPGAGGEFTSENIEEKSFVKARIVHIEGYLLEDIPVVEKAMQLAKHQGSMISLDLGCTRIAKKFKNEILRLISTYVDIVFANEDEVEALLNSSFEKGCLKLSDYSPVAVILAGHQGSWVGSKDSVTHIPTMPVEVLDTTGAGDLFAAGFLHGYLQGYPLAECAWIGNLLGSTVVSVRGAEIPREKWIEIREKIKNHFTNSTQTE